MRQEQQPRQLQAPVEQAWFEEVALSAPQVLVWAELTALEGL